MRYSSAQRVREQVTKDIEEKTMLREMLWMRAIAGKSVHKELEENAAKERVSAKR